LRNSGIFFTSGLVVSLVCAALIGGGWVGIVCITLSTIGRFHPSNPAKAMARMTISFGVANILAPTISGYIAAQTGSYRGALVMAGVVMMIGIVLLIPLLTAWRDLSLSTTD
jgi:MFS family permease